jgi:hypothetical protein
MCFQEETTCMMDRPMRWMVRDKAGYSYGYSHGNGSDQRLSQYLGK